VTISALFPSGASATFHLMSIREVYPGSIAAPAAEYVELQMYASGQNLVAGHVLNVYDSSGSLVKSNSLGGDVPNGQSQRTVLIATPEAESAFGFGADEALSPSGQLDPAGGAVCWENIDCISWGGFAGASLPSPAGAPTVAIPDGMALRRSISANCPTLLESVDDTNSSAANLAVVFPDPRANSAAPAEQTCGTGDDGAGNGAGGGGGGGGGVPQTIITHGPGHRTRDRTPTFRFTADERPSRFTCKVDGKPFRSCRSPFVVKRLPFGMHFFRVKAVHEGAADPTPAVWRFRVLRRR
jgi:hypothetical protein